MGVHFLAPAILGAGWPALPPGKPTNVTVLSGQTWASIRWASASQSEGGGETNHFSLKWQYKNGAEAEWFPYWVGPDQDEAMLLSLGSGVTIATRVAAVNQYGRTWSDFVVFSTTASLVCDEAYEFRGVMETADIELICGGAELHVPVDPHRSPCSVTRVEYAFAGVAAGVMLVLLATAMVIHTCCTKGEQAWSSILLRSTAVNEPGTASPAPSDGEDASPSTETSSRSRVSKAPGGGGRERGSGAGTGLRRARSDVGSRLKSERPVPGPGPARRQQEWPGSRHGRQPLSAHPDWPGLPGWQCRSIPATPATPHSHTALLGDFSGGGPRVDYSREGHGGYGGGYDGGVRGGQWPPWGAHDGAGGRGAPAQGWRESERVGWLGSGEYRRGADGEHRRAGAEDGPPASGPGRHDSRGGGDGYGERPADCHGHGREGDCSSNRYAGGYSEREGDGCGGWYGGCGEDAPTSPPQCPPHEPCCHSRVSAPHRSDAHYGRASIGSMHRSIHGTVHTCSSPAHAEAADPPTHQPLAPAITSCRAGSDGAFPSASPPRRASSRPCAPAVLPEPFEIGPPSPNRCASPAETAALGRVASALATLRLDAAETGAERRSCATSEVAARHNQFGGRVSGNKGSGDAGHCRRSSRESAASSGEGECSSPVVGECQKQPHA